jgi:hypothetical protein
VYVQDRDDFPAPKVVPKPAVDSLARLKGIPQTKFPSARLTGTPWNNQLAKAEVQQYRTITDARCGRWRTETTRARSLTIWHLLGKATDSRDDCQKRLPDLNASPQRSVRILPEATSNSQDDSQKGILATRGVHGRVIQKRESASLSLPYFQGELADCTKTRTLFAVFDPEKAVIKPRIGLFYR